MSKTLTSAAVMAGAAFFTFAAQALAQTSSPACNPEVGHANSRIECLAKITHSLNEEIASLRSQLGQCAKTTDLSVYLKPSDLDDRLGAYVKYNAPLAINMLVEPSTGQLDGRCLEAYVGEVGVVAHKPCNFESKQELKWRLLPAGGKSEASRYAGDKRSRLSSTPADPTYEK